MNSIPVEVSGDTWCNPQQVKQALEQIPQGKKAILDFRAEGPSIQALGIKSVLDAWLQQRCHGPEMIEITCWSNATEIVPYGKSMCSVPSHFWGMSRDYWQSEINLGTKEYLFGLFVGRSTVSRNVILYECYQEFFDSFLLSRMVNKQPDPWHPRLSNMGYHTTESLDEWTATPENVIAWFENCPVSSIDQKTVRDQFVNLSGPGVCNRSLLEHYHRFDVELVCETYTAGTTFFPTEKTVRPIMSQKPMLVFGPVNFLAELRNMGFETYHSVWDESYDQLHGRQRWLAIKELIKNLRSLTLHQREIILDRCAEIAHNNRNHLTKLIKL